MEDPGRLLQPFMNKKAEQIYIFNPEHDLCIANGDENFVPPRSAVGFAKENIDLYGHLMRPNKQRRKIIPWGWNHSLRKRLLLEGVDPATLPSEEELQFIRTHSRREFALDVHSQLSGGGSLIIGPDYRIVATCVSEIEAFISANGSAVLKSPLSGSGKGIRFVRERLSESDEGWCRRTLDKQGSVIVEKRFDIIKECAMLFECHHEGLDFIGYSLFESRNGAYIRNILASNEDIEDVIAGHISRNTLTAVRENLISILADTLVAEGFDLVSGGTDNHLMLVDLRNFDVTGKEMEHRLDEVHITVNKNTVPNETQSPFVTSGLRIGTPAVTSRGFKEEEMLLIAGWIKKVATDFEGSKDQITKEVTELCAKFPIY